MKTLAVAALVLLTSASAFAQLPDAAAVAANPVTLSARMLLAEDTENIVSAANLMPAEKYAYHPTPAQMTFGALMQHIAQSNVRICSAIAGAPVAPPAVAATAPKAALVSAVTGSFKTCQSAFAKMADGQMGEMVDVGGDKAPRAYLVLVIVADWADHYSTAASYLRMNGILPPTARPQ